jgi:hypothetical protein
MPMQGK